MSNKASFFKLSNPHSIRLIYLVSVLALLSACGGKSNQDSTQGGGETPTYKTLVLEPRSATLNTDYPANIQGLQNIEIRPKVDGFVENIYVDEGSIVKQGQLLFRIKAPQYEQDVRTAEAGIKTAEADLSAARLQVSKVKPLVEKDIINKFELEEDQYTLQSKQASLAQAKAALENAKVNLGYTTITSPVNGVVGSLPFKLGSLVTSATTDPLTTVYNTATVFAYFAMNEKQLLAFNRDSTHKTAAAQLKNLPPVTLLLSDGTLYREKGKVETINGLINTATGSANFRAAFPNPQGLLRSGGSATVRIPAIVNNVIIIPQNVTYELQDKRFTFLVDKDNKIRNAVITVMDNTPGQFFIITGGLKTGDRIVIESVSNIADGTLIKPNDVSAASVYKDLK